MEKQFKAIRSIFVPLFEEAIECGDLPEDRDSVIMARTMLTYGQGLGLMAKTTIDRKELLGMIEIMKGSLKQ